jgi:flagellar FliL protein
MSTAPTVLAGASTSSPSVPTSPLPPGATKIPVFSLLLAVITGVVIATLGIGGVVYYLVRTGHLPTQHAVVTQKSEEIVPVATHALVLEPLLVNLAGAGGGSYLRVALTLRVADVADKKGAQSKDEKSNDGKSDDEVAAVRDTVLTVLGRQTADDLLATDGKERLKAAMKIALAEHNTGLKVMDVFYTDFLVQR